MIVPAALAAVLLIVALVLRLHGLTSEDLWLDEFFSAELSTGRGYADQHLPRNQFIADAPDLTSLSGAPSWPAMWTSMREDTHPPLYFLALRLWRTVFGSSDASMRAMSVFFSLVAIAALVAVGAIQFDWTTALWAGLMMALATPQIVYAQEARNNPMVLGLALCSAATLVWIEKQGETPRRLILLGAFVIATMLTHYYCVGVIAAMFAYVALVMRRRMRWRVLLALSVSVGIYAIIWGPILLQQGLAFAEWHKDVDPSARSAAVILQRLGVAPLRQLIGIRIDSAAAAAIAALTYAYGFALVLLFRRRDLWLWWLWGAAVFAVLLAHDIRRTSNHLLLPKYAILASPAVFLIIAAAPASFRGKFRWLRHAIPAAAVAACLWFLPSAYEPKYGHWSSVANAILSRAAPGDVVVFVPGHRLDWSGGWGYLAVTHYVHHWPMPVMILDHGFDDATTRNLHSTGARNAFIIADVVVDDPTAILRVDKCGTVWQLSLPQAK